MNKPITKDIHILIDYSYAAIVPLLPELTGFKKNTTASNACRILGLGALGYTLLTKAPRAPFKVLPFKTHLIIDASVSLFALAAPWLLKFAKNAAARNTLLAVGAAGLVASLLTDPADSFNKRQ